MNIGILICGHFSDDIKARYGTYRDLYADMLGPGYACRPYFVVDGEFPASITEQDGWLVSGSRSGAYEDHPWIPPLEGFLRDAYAADVPIVGICFGHQILAQALGGTVEKYAGGWSFGPVEYRFRDGPSQTIVAVHQDQVTVPPKDAARHRRDRFLRLCWIGLCRQSPQLSASPRVQHRLHHRLDRSLR